MRVLILVDCYPPSPKSGAKLIHDLAEEFVRQGHETIVVTPDDTLAARRWTTIEDGLTVARVRSGRIKGAGKVLRAINEIRLSSIVWRACSDFSDSTWRADLVRHRTLPFRADIDPYLSRTAPELVPSFLVRVD